MLSLSKKTDYALLALSHLAKAEAGRAVNTREIADQFGIPVELLAKILQRLAKVQLVVSTPGPTGGYRLAKPATAISVGAVISVIEGPTAIAHCMKSFDNRCEQHNRCTIRHPLERINARIYQMLDLISLAEINRDDAGLDRFVPLVTQGV
jgi:Rrf2 family protein